MSISELPTLLVVTDNPSIRYWVRKHLEAEFFILEAITKHAALLQAHTARLDFIIIDSLLEDCDPLWLCSELKKVSLTLTPLLLITGRLKQSFLKEAYEAGATDFLSNQLDGKELKEKVELIRKGQSLRYKTKEASGTLKQKRHLLSSNFLKNRVALENKALNLLEEANRKGSPISSLFIKVDHFEEMQKDEKFDETLDSLSDLIQASISQEDLLIPATDGRFVALLKDVSPIEGREIARKLREKISAMSFKTVQPTVSIVVTSLAGTERDFKNIVDSSFKALKKTTQDLIISIDETKT
jgi:diguanylate cyclase (GGDEF)-like protein